MATLGSRPLGGPQRFTRLYALVEGQFEPRHFRFVTVVPKSGKGPGGWRAACVGLALKRDPGVDSFLCRFGVEMPLETRHEKASRIDIGS